MTDPEIQELLLRIENWRRHYRVTQRIHAVSWYTPPELGDVMQEPRIRFSTDMKDAILLENCWRNLQNEPKKVFIKLEFISKLPRPVIWRKLKRLGERLKSDSDHFLFGRSALEYMHKQLSVKRIHV